MHYNRNKGIVMRKVEKEFELINAIIERRWERALGLANAEALMSYWTVGAFVSSRLKSAEWGSKTVEALSDYLKTRNPKRRGFGKRHIYNMVSFYDTYSSAAFQDISYRLRLDDFVQEPTVEIGDAEIVQSPIAQTDKCATFVNSTSDLPHASGNPATSTSDFFAQSESIRSFPELP